MYIYNPDPAILYINKTNLRICSSMQSKYFGRYQYSNFVKFDFGWMQKTEIRLKHISIKFDFGWMKKTNSDWNFNTGNTYHLRLLKLLRFQLMQGNFGHWCLRNFKASIAETLSKQHFPKVISSNHCMLAFLTLKVQRTWWSINLYDSCLSQETFQEGIDSQ